MCLFSFDYEDLQLDLVAHVCWMEYPLPGPVVALLRQEKASLAPTSYFISSGKKSIKITLVYSKDEEPTNLNLKSSGEKNKSRHGSSSQSMSRTTRRKNLSESSSTTNTDQTSESLSQSDSEQACISPDFRLREKHQRGRERMSTVDSGHPSSSCTITNELDVHSESGSEGGDEECDYFSSSDSEKPPTPGREIAVPASTIGPGETPSARRDEMWQTWTRIPRTPTSGRRLLAATISTVRQTLAPSTSSTQRNTTSNVTQRRPHLHEGVAWDGSGNL